MRGAHTPLLDQAGLEGVELFDGSGRVDPASLNSGHRRAGDGNRGGGDAEAEPDRGESEPTRCRMEW